MLTAARTVIFLGIALFFHAGILYADYTLVLKNGGRLTVQSYREEGGMIKFQGLGGEIGIARDQIQSILQTGKKQEKGMVVPGAERGLPRSESSAPPETKATSIKEKEAEDRKDPVPQGSEKPPSAEGKLTEERTKEEKEYQKRIGEVTAQLKAARDRYSLATGGTGGREPTLLQSEEAIKARTDDLNSRLRDAQNNPSGPSDAGGVKLSTPSPFTGAPPSVTELPPAEVIRRVDSPPPGYTQKERELSDLRSQINRLENERERLIQEMKRKNFDTGSVFLE